VSAAEWLATFLENFCHLEKILDNATDVAYIIGERGGPRFGLFDERGVHVREFLDKENCYDVACSSHSPRDLSGN